MGEAMKRFKLVQSDADIVSHSGLVLVGRALSECTDLKADLDAVRLRHGTRHSDVMLAYTALLALGKNDFEAINTIESPDYFRQALGIGRIPSEAMLRQRMDERARDYMAVLIKANRDFLVRSRPTLTPVSTGHVALDVDVTPFDNSASHKEGVSWTYKRHDGAGMSSRKRMLLIPPRGSLLVQSLTARKACCGGSSACVAPKQGHHRDSQVESRIQDKDNLAGNKKPATVIREWADRPKAWPVADARHYKLVAHGIWVWTGGDIEHHLGLVAGKKDSTTRARFNKRLKEDTCQQLIAETAVIEAFVTWLSPTPTSTI